MVRKTSFLASISGISEAEFVQHWNRLRYKFVHEGDFISHKRCMKELLKTDRLVKSARKGGINSGKSRSYKKDINNIREQVASKGLATPVQLLNETNTKQNNNKTNTSNVNPIFQKTLDSIKNSDSLLKSSSLSDSSRSSDDNSEPHPNYLLYRATSHEQRFHYPQYAIRCPLTITFHPSFYHLPPICRHLSAV